MDAASESQDGETSLFTSRPRHPPHAKFTAEEDAQLRSQIEARGHNSWYEISLRMPGRTPRQCKERWAYHLSPTLNNRPWTREEDIILIERQRELGNHWAVIAKCFANRTDGMVKNRFNCLMRKQPHVGHAPLSRAAMTLAWVLGISGAPAPKKSRPSPVAFDPPGEQGGLAIPPDCAFDTASFDGEFEPFLF
jgi:hypothetical protein